MCCSAGAGDVTRGDGLVFACCATGRDGIGCSAVDCKCDDWGTSSGEID